VTSHRIDIEPSGDLNRLPTVLLGNDRSVLQGSAVTVASTGIDADREALQLRLGAAERRACFAAECVVLSAVSFTAPLRLLRATGSCSNSL
jgi:hypothetical protein